MDRILNIEIENENLDTAQQTLGSEKNVYSC